MSSIKQAAALGSEITAENPETYSNKSGENALDDANTITRSICTSDQPQSSVQCMSSPWPNSTISPQGLVQEVLNPREALCNHTGCRQCDILQYV